MTLGGVRGDKLAAELEIAAAKGDNEGVQKALRRMTGNFKRGNEHLSKR